MGLGLVRYFMYKWSVNTWDAPAHAINGPVSTNYVTGSHVVMIWHHENNKNSISYKTFHYKILQELKAATFFFRIMWSLWTLTIVSTVLSTAVEASVNFKAIQSFYYQHRGFQTVQDLIMRVLMWYWNGHLYPLLLTCINLDPRMNK